MEMIQKEKLVSETIVESFKRNVLKNPDRTALVYENMGLSFKELDIITNNIGKVLRDKNIKENDIVAAEFFTSIEMIIGVLSILKAGAAYLPISPSYPDNRILDILEDSKAKLLITRKKDISSVTLNSIGTEVVYIDNYKEYLKEDVELENINKGEDLAYIIYTSGSTGKPKGVKVKNENVLNLVEGLYENIYINYNDNLNVALMAAFVFDASVQQIFASLLLGHTLYVVPEEIRADGNALVEYFMKNHINISDGTPSHLKILQNSIKSKMTVEHFIIGGEELNTRVIQGFYNHFDCDTKITNIYGITECCVDSSAYLIDRNTKLHTNIVPIGKPLKNTKIYILRDDLSVCKKNEVGEIYIAGAGVGAGYVNETLNKEKFLKSPFEEGEVIYKTGDQGKILDSGDIECSGRIDNQVKVRGFRIELGEIENKIDEFINEKSNIDELNHKNDEHLHHCKKCFLSSRVPELTFDSNDVCSFCNDFSEYKPYVDKYFTNMNDFNKIVEKAKSEKKSEYDCLLLYSGGKDSSYVLFKLIDMGLKVLTFTFDNGYISDTAFENINKVTTELNVPNITLKMENMDEMFLKELKTNSTVCNSCFRALTYLSTKLAYEKNINLIITGLSRGQIFDTKLYSLYSMGVYEPEEIDEKLLLYRKMYHNVNDNIADIMQEDFTNEDYFKDKYFVDYYRYDNVTTEEINDYLEKNPSWSKPKNTGFCSTNCAINNVGIYMHMKNKKFHNYEKPLSWDYRLGVIEYDNAVKKLDDNIDLKQVNEILDKLGYDSVDIIQDFVVTVKDDESGDKFICAYFKCDSEYNFNDMKEYLKNKLPEYMIPSYYIKVKEIPLTINGKVDVRKLPNPHDNTDNIELNAKDMDDITQSVFKIWSKLLGTTDIELDDNFFDIGGDSFKANILISELYKNFNVEIPLLEIYQAPTIEEIKEVIENKKKETSSNIALDNKNLIIIRKAECSTEEQRNIFLVHDAIGQIDSFKKVAANVNNNINVVGINVIDFYDYDINSVSIENIAKNYIEQIKQVQAVGPYYLVGWSFGGTLVYEMAKQLELSNDKVGLVGIIDNEVPDCELWDKEYDQLRETYKYLNKYYADEEVATDSEQVVSVCNNINDDTSKIEGSDYKKYIPQFVKDIIVNFEQCSAKEINGYLYLITSVVKALKEYSTEKINSDITLFNAVKENHPRDYMDWGLWTNGEITIHNLNDNHMSIVENTEISNIINTKVK